nr:hypothetical protein MACL_00001031 [Theileria orientalis]
MGKVKEIGIGEEFEEAAVSQIDHDGLNVLIQDHHELGYRCLSYSDEGRRFTISKLNCSEAPINISDLPFYSVLGFYVFHHGSSTSPLFLCAVYEVKHDKIFVWYIMSPANSNYFSINYISVYGTKFENVKFKSVKEIHVFEHSNMHHYKQ